MPAHARIVGDVHLLNASAADATTSLKFDVYSTPPTDLMLGLPPMAFTNVSLDIAPNGITDARLSCAVPQPDFGVYYVLPHFHVLGQVLLLDVVGGPMDGQNGVSLPGHLRRTAGGTSSVTDAGGVHTTDAVCAGVSWPAPDQ